MNIINTSTPTTSVSLISIGSVSNTGLNANTKTNLYSNLKTHTVTNINIGINPDVNRNKDIQTYTRTHTSSGINTESKTKVNGNKGINIKTKTNSGTNTKSNGFNSNSRVDSNRQNSLCSLSSNLAYPSPSLRSAYQVKRATALKKSFSSIRSSSFDDRDLLFDRSISFLSHRSSIFSGTSSVKSIEKHPLTNLESEFAIDDDDYNDISNKLETNVLELNSNLGEACNLKDSVFSEASRNHKHITNLLNFFKKVVFNKSKPCTRLLRVHGAVTPIKPCFQDVPLETFSQELNTILLNNQPSLLPTDINVNEDYDRFLLLSLNGKTRRFREIRINPKYLLIYAIDSSARSKGFLQISEHELDIFEQHLFEQQQSSDFDYGQLEWKLLAQFKKFTKVDKSYISDLKLASLSRYKLWATVTLPPRKDPVPNYKKLIENIVPVAGLDFCEVPWSNLKNFKQGKSRNKVQNPAGLLPNSNIQYVSKNCVSKRWVSWS